MATATQTFTREQLFVGGEWVDPAGADSIEVVNPTTEETMGTIPAGTPEDVDRAAAAARSAFEAWSQTSREERADYLGAIAAGLTERGDEIAATISQELGMPVKLSRMIQAGLPTMSFGSMPQLIGEVAWEERAGNSLIVREAAGVVGAITPWNYPLHQIAAKVAPALAAGCTVVCKPSEVVPLNAFILAEVIEAAGLPAGVFNLVTGTGPVVGEAIAAHPAGRHGLLHGIDPGRQAGLRAGLCHRQAGGDGAGRKEPQRDPRRRRLRGGGARRRRQVLPQLGPDLLGADPDAGPARAARRGGGDRRRGGGAVRARRPVRARPPGSARWSPTSSATGSVATSRRARPRARGC